MSEELEWEKKWKAREKQIDDKFKTRFAWQFKEFTEGGYKYRAEVSTGEGWDNLVRDMCQEVEDFFGVGMGYPDKGFKWTQIKSKFGTLRAYCRCDKKLEGEGMQKLLDLIHKYEERSAVTCEVCGADAKTQNLGGWIATLCPTHYEQHMKERQERYGDDD